MIEVFFGLVIMLGLWIATAEVLRWKVTWFNQRPVLTYFLAFCLWMFVNMIFMPSGPELEQALEEAIRQEMMNW